ncbi:restriction endonuclease [Rhodococcus oryzae]|uniref:Restriction endonuclease n=1 Tax=Rhodococcus oryzae TaxID=2571143 RepID=A0ABY2RFW0_9NOCA|nr:restriction endonuclease [Rhodococcus oryzae]TJZ75814.1 restriction endonuclease [Rhodococcus oryzae]
MAFLEDWDLSYDEINELLTANPSLRSFVMGYAAEIKCRNMYFTDHPDLAGIYKPDDHDRTEKGDWIITYKGNRIGVEVKSIQSNSMQPRKRGGLIKPNYQCDASDARTVHFSDGSSVHTTALLVGEFDIVAVNTHAFRGEWDFAFVKNSDLVTMEGATRGSARDYTPLQQKNLIKTLQPIDLNPKAPYSRDPFKLFDEIIEERRRGDQPMMAGVIKEEA